jgi:hypothetical protein
LKIQNRLSCLHSPSPFVRLLFLAGVTLADGRHFFI